MAELTEYIRVNFPLTLKDERVIAANSLRREKRERKKIFLETVDRFKPT